MTMLKNIEAKTYTRTDLATTDSRVGFISQHVQEWAPSEFANLIAQVSEDILGLDYSRFSPLLWTIAEEQQQLIEGLTSRLSALEAKKTKKVKE